MFSTGPVARQMAKIMRRPPVLLVLFVPLAVRRYEGSGSDGKRRGGKTGRGLNEGDADGWSRWRGVGHRPSRRDEGSARARRTCRRTAAGRGNDGRAESGTASDGVIDRARSTMLRGSAAAAEQRAAQAPQRCEERDPSAPALVGLRPVTRGQLAHQQGRLGRLAPGHGGTAEHREMTVEARTGRAAPACDGRDSRPAVHRYLFHVTPHPYEGTRPGQVNPIAPS